MTSRIHKIDLIPTHFLATYYLDSLYPTPFSYSRGKGCGPAMNYSAYIIDAKSFNSLYKAFLALPYNSRGWDNSELQGLPSVEGEREPIK